LAYIGRNPGGGHASFFEAVEFGAHNDARALSPLANSNMMLNNADTTILPMRHFNRAPILPTTGLLYSSDP